MFSLTDRTALITGGTSGIGKAVAERYARSGARVAIVGRRAEGEEIAAAIGVAFIRADVTQEDQVGEALEQAESRLGRLDIVVNNAGLENTGPTITEHSGEELARIFKVNLDGVYYGLRHAPRHMNDGGSIINTASVAGVLGVPGYGQYAATKAGVISLTKTAAMELAPRQIRVNAVCPGSVWSEMLPPDHPEVAITTIMTPLGRIADPEEDVAGLYHFLAAPESNYITGQAICVDGGLSAGIGYGTLAKVLA